MNSIFVFWSVVTAAAVAGFVHTLAGPDHYLPFIALARVRGWSMVRTMGWTFVCGIGHIASALLIAGIFYFFAQWLSKEHYDTFQEYRNSVAAWLLIALGTGYAIWGLHAAFRNKLHEHVHEHEDGNRHAHVHRHSCVGHRHWHERPDNAKIIPWIIFIILAFGPCEALWPLLVAATVVGTTCLVVSTIVFSVVTVATMMVAVWLGVHGARLVRFGFLERYVHVIAGLAIALCGIAIAFFGL